MPMLYDDEIEELFVVFLLILAYPTLLSSLSCFGPQ